jgi:hypothetical protein
MGIVGFEPPCALLRGGGLRPRVSGLRFTAASFLLCVACIHGNAGATGNASRSVVLDNDLWATRYVLARVGTSSRSAGVGPCSAGASCCSQSAGQHSAR